jgi:P-aminobenzoate N-oxygenase AurF
VSTRHYALPVEQTRWQVEGQHSIVFNWEYDETRDRMLGLYEKGKTKQWNASDRLDWSHQPDPDNPLGAQDEYISIYGSPLWARLGPERRVELRRHLAAWSYSQFMHGEQGALICAAKIVQTVPDVDSKFYAATQVMDEARHVETYSRYLREKLGLAYPINPSLRALLGDVITDSRWDVTYLGMQVLIEGLALAAFAMQRDHTHDPLARTINAYVMQDEARHVAFGRIALREHYPQLTEAERADREEFAIEACHLMRDRFLAEELWENLGFQRHEFIDSVRSSRRTLEFRSQLFSRIVPTLRDIGLFGRRVREAFVGMGVMHHADTDAEAMSERDERVADEMERIDRERRSREVARAVRLGATG